MQIRRFHPILLLLLTALRPIEVLAQDAVKAKELLESVAAGMKEASAIAFESEIRTRIESIDVAQRAVALLARPNLARLEVSGAAQDALIVLDGTTAWHHLKARNRFMKARQLGTIKIEQYGVGPLAILFFEKTAGSLLPYLSDATVAHERIGDDACSVIAWSVGTEETRLWVSGNRLRRYTTVRAVGGKKFEQSFEYGAINLAPSIPEGAFTFVPPAGTTQMAAGDETKLLVVGASAPDFAVTRPDGTPLKLSDFKGKPVVLSFWFYACATCREEFRRLQKLQDAGARRGLVIIAVNFGDSPDVVRAYFEKEKFTFIPALQNDKDVSTAYGVQAYPTNYVIGPDGKVVFRAAGFDETSLEAALEKLAQTK
jgi:cytochrome c biogenesis protein CcmG/thiol:disulfide interchange protein DsbE